MHNEALIQAILDKKRLIDVLSDKYYQDPLIKKSRRRKKEENGDSSLRIPKRTMINRNDYLSKFNDSSASAPS